MCFRCNYKTKYIGSMRKHFNNKKRCERCTDSLKYSDDEILHQWKFNTPIKHRLGVKIWL